MFNTLSFIILPNWWNVKPTETLQNNTKTTEADKQAELVNDNDFSF